jgi:cytoskeletal protein CcmA (bactofilin family)
MTNKLKMLLKTTAAVATLMVGSQSWAAELVDALDADQAAANISIGAGGYGVYRAQGAVTVTYAGAGGGVTVDSGGTIMFYLAPSVSTSFVFNDPLVLNSNASLYLIKNSGLGAFDLSGAVVSSPINAAATDVKIYLTQNTTLPNMSAMLGTTIYVLDSLTLTGVAAGFGGYIDIHEGKTLTSGTWTACGGVSGSGTFAAANTNFTINGNVIGDVTLNLSGMTTAARAFVVTGSFATSKAFTSVPGSGADGTTTVGGDMVLGAAFTTAGAGVTVTTGDLSVAGLTTVAALAPLVVTAGDASLNALTANAALTVTAGDATFAGAVSAAAAADFTVGRDATFSSTFASVTGANLSVGRDVTFAGVVTSAAGNIDVTRNAIFGAAVTSSGAVDVGGNATFSGLLTSSGAVDIAGNASFAALTATNAVDVAGSATFSGAVAANHADAKITLNQGATFSSTFSSVAGADLTVTGGAATFVGAVTSAAGDIDVTGNATFSSAVTASGNINVTGNGSFAGALSSSGTVDIAGNASFAALTATKAIDVAGSAIFSGAVAANHADAKITLHQGATFSSTFSSVTGADLTVVGGDATFAGVVTASGALILDRNVTFADDVAAGGLNVVGNAVFEGDLAVGASGALSIAGSVNLKGDLTAGASSQIILPGAIVGTGSINLSAITAGIPSFGDASGYTGAVVLGSQPVSFAKAPVSVFTGHQNNVTLTNGGTVTRMVSAGTSARVTGGAGGDVVISEYDVPNAFAATFVPGAGKKMTVTTLTQHSTADEALTVSASTGTMIFNSNINAGGFAAHTFSAPTSIKKYTLLAGATPVISINENVTIDELVISAAGVAFEVAAGKTLTIKKVTGHNNVTVNGAGTLSVKLPTDYTGNVVTGGTAKLITK